nr:DUF998 domain-containing protein [Salinilacihabitans rarus]
MVDEELGDASATRIAGASLVLAGATAFMGIITAEVLYPGYSTRQDISDLGSTMPPNPIIHEPSATIFNSTMLLTGALVLVATYLVHRGLGRRVLTIPLAVFGVGIFGVGVFPGNVTPWHGLFAMVTFISGGVTVVLSSKVVARPFSYLCVLFGGTSLLVLTSVLVFGLAGSVHPLQFLGSGGIERWVVYPLLVWILAFGGYLLGDAAGDRAVE